MLLYRQQFEKLLGVKSEPNLHEKMLFARAQIYIRKLAWIPGIEMVAVVNSLSMYATHPGSDIDLFIVTKPNTIWIVRVCVTLTLWWHGVWRHGEDIAGNFCLSFYCTSEAMDLTHIAIDDDIYLWYWIYFLKPIFVRGDIYEQFLQTNHWVRLDESQKQKSEHYIIGVKSPIIVPDCIMRVGERVLRYIFLRYTERTHRQLGEPSGVIISERMLKFHDQDRRASIRDQILKNLEKNFDKR